MDDVSHETEKLCATCNTRPRKRGQAYCGPCHRDYMRNWRAGFVERRLSAEEWAAVELLRAAMPAEGQPGRHRIAS
jgi:hypothetical protein